MTKILSTAICLFILLLASCNGGGGTPQATSGAISGTLTVAGPFNGAADLNVGLFPPGSNTPAATANAGRLTSAATATLNGRTITFNFTEIPFGTYNVGLYYDAAGTLVFLYRSGDLVLNEEHHALSGQDATASFTGSGPFGSITGATTIAGTWPGQDKLVFIGLAPQSNPSAALQQLVTATAVNEGVLHYGLESVAYGTYFVGLYGYDPVTHQVTPFGQFDTPVTVSATQPNATNVNFGSDFAGDPGTDPQLGSVSGTVTFNGALPQGGYYYVAANTIPPQQGPPPAVFAVYPADIANNSLAYDLTFLPAGDYSVSIFSYDITSHQVTYFGQHNQTVTVAASGAGQHVAGVDFAADVTLL